MREMRGVATRSVRVLPAMACCRLDFVTREGRQNIPKCELRETRDGLTQISIEGIRPKQIRANPRSMVALYFAIKDHRWFAVSASGFDKRTLLSTLFLVIFRPVPTQPRTPLASCAIENPYGSAIHAPFESNPPKSP